MRHAISIALAAIALTVVLVWTANAQMSSPEENAPGLTNPLTSDLLTSGNNILLNVGDRVTFDNDVDANNYMTAASDAVMSMYVEGIYAVYFTSGGIGLTDGKRLLLGSGPDMWWEFDGLNTVLESSDCGAGVCELINIPLGGDAVNFPSGNISVESGNFVCLNGSTCSRYIYESGSTVFVVGPLRPTGNLVLTDNIQAAYGSGTDYWQDYNSTSTELCLTSTDADGIGTDGDVWCVDDGTDDVAFSGGASFNASEQLVFDADADGNNYLVGEDANIQVWIEGAIRSRFESSGFKLFNNRQLSLGDVPSYNLRFRSADTSLVLEGDDCDGGGTNCDILTIADGTDDVSFSGDINLEVGSDLRFDGPSGNDYLNNPQAAQIDTYVGGTRKLSVKATAFNLFDGVVLTWGTDVDYSAEYDTVGTEFCFSTSDIDGGGTDGDVWCVDDGTSVLQTKGGRRIKHTGVSDANYTPLDGDEVIGYTSVTASRTIDPQDSTCVDGRVYTIKDQSGSLAGGPYTLTIDPEGATTIDGATSIAIASNYGSRSIYCDGGAWYTY